MQWNWSILKIIFYFPAVQQILMADDFKKILHFVFTISSYRHVSIEFAIETFHWGGGAAANKIEIYIFFMPYGSSERSLKVPESKDPYVIHGFVLSPEEGLLLVDDVVMVKI